MKHIEGLEAGLLGAEKGVGMNWRQWEMKAFACKRTVREPGPKVWQVPPRCLRQEASTYFNSRREEKAKKKTLKTLVFRDPFRIELPRK